MSALSPSATSAATEWRCHKCGKLLGVVRCGRIHLQFTRGHQYVVGMPVMASCRGCGTMNELDRQSVKATAAQ